MEAGFRPYPELVFWDSIYPLKPWLIPPIGNDVNRPEQRGLQEHMWKLNVQ